SRRSGASTPTRWRRAWPRPGSGPRCTRSRRASRTCSSRSSTRSGRCGSSGSCGGSDVRLFGMIWKELVQLRRDPMALTLALFIPVVMLFIFGYAINTDVKHLPTVVVDESRGVEAQELLEAFANTRYFDLRFAAGSAADAARLLDSGRAKVAILIPPDFAARLRANRNAAVQVLVDASDPQVAASAVNAATALGLARSIELLRRDGPAAGGAGLDVRIRAWYNPDQESALFIVPGLIGALLMQTTITVMAIAVVRERERGTLEALVVSPLRRWE